MNDYGWFQRVKDKEFESNSQLKNWWSKITGAGFSVSKIKNLKAIHNLSLAFRAYFALVSACQR